MRPTLAVLFATLLAACATQPGGTPAEPSGSITPDPTALSPTIQPGPSGPAAPSGQVAYVSGADPQIFLLDLATGESRQLTHLVEADARVTSRGPLAPVLSCAFGPQSLAWSPDGSLLAFSYGSCDAVVHVVDLDGELTRIGDGRGPAWSPDGRTLVFAPNAPFCPGPIAFCGEPPAPGAWNLQVADIDAGTGARPLMEDDVTQFAGQPAYSPDGSLIAFTARIPDAAEHPELFAAAYVANADGSDVRLIARGAWPTGWLPDGRVVLVDEQSSELRAVDLQTTDAEPLGESPGPAALAPDGSRVLLSKFDPVSGAGSVELRTIDGDALAALDGSVGGWAPDSGAALVLDLEATGGFVVIDRDGAVLETYELPDPFNVFWVAWRPGS